MADGQAGVWQPWGSPDDPRRGASPPATAPEQPLAPAEPGADILVSPSAPAMVSDVPAAASAAAGSTVPSSRAPRRTTLGALVAGLLCVSAAGIIVVQGQRGSQGLTPPGPGPTAIATVATTTPAASPSLTTTEDTSVVTSDAPGAPITRDSPSAATPSRPAAPSPEALATAALLVLAREGRDRTTLDGEWAAQLASKAVGITDPLQTTGSGSHTFMAVDILAEHRRLVADFSAYGDVRLLSSTDYGKRSTYHGRPIMVTLLFAGLGTRDAVQSFCAQQFPTLSGASLDNVCLPRQVNPPS